MTYAILWISHVGFGLLLVAAVTAVASRCERIIERRFAPIFAAIFIFISFVPLMDLGYQIVTDNLQPKWLFWYSLSEIINDINRLVQGRTAFRHLDHVGDREQLLRLLQPRPIPTVAVERRLDFAARQRDHVLDPDFVATEDDGLRLTYWFDSDADLHQGADGNRH